MTTQIKVCRHINYCPKVEMILDKQYDVPELYAKVIEEVCARCKEE